MGEREGGVVGLGLGFGACGFMIFERATGVRSAVKAKPDGRPGGYRPLDSGRGLFETDGDLGSCRWSRGQGITAPFGG